MTGVDGTAGLDQIALPPHAHCSVDLNEGGQKPEEKKTQMDGVQEENDDRQRTRCKQAEQDVALQKIRSCTVQNNQKMVMFK